ncbi:MAG: hypothetical protein FWH48_04400 [Oscillospiraceae bacterium]|nr:hypothetical protein [Oscillospiraceae bacterium]
MKKKAGWPKVYQKAALGVLALALLAISLLAAIVGTTKADPLWPNILYFEQESPVFEKVVEARTSLEGLDLPTELMAMVEIRAATPTDLSGATPTNLPAPGTEVVSLKIPVSWEGNYESDNPGLYTLTAKIDDGYVYDGEMPSGTILVKPPPPMSMSRAYYTLANLAMAGRNDLIQGIDGLSWRVVRSKELNGVTYYLLVTSTTHHHNEINNSRFSTTSSDYNGSLLQGRMTAHYNSYPTIRAIAVVPDLGSHSNISATSEPTAEMALGSGKTVDIMFALSRQDYVNWNNGYTTPLYAPLNASSYGQRSWSRTSRNADELYGIINASGSNYKGIDAGLNYSGYTNIGEIPAVWVNGDAVWREITVYYVDTEGNSIGAGSKVYPVLAGETLILYDPADIPEIGNYEYREYKKGSFGNASQGSVFASPILTKQEVLDGTDIYLVYELTAQIKVTVHYIDKATGSSIRTASVHPVDGAGNFELLTIPTVLGYSFANEWKEGSTSAPSQSPPVAVTNVTLDRDIYLYYNKLVMPPSGTKNAYTKESPNANNGTAQNPVLVMPEDKIRYTITADNYTLPGVSGAKYDILFVLDWSQSMDIGWMYGSGADTRTAREYELDVMLDMFDFVTANYPDSRVAVTAMNSTGMHADLGRTYLQYDTAFMTPSEYKNGGRAAMETAFLETWKYPTEDPSTFLNIATYKMQGLSYAVGTGLASGSTKYFLPRLAPTGGSLSDRIPVIVLISDFQIPKGQSIGGISGSNYWRDAMKTQSDRFNNLYPNGILHTVRFDHLGNHTGLNDEYSNSEFDQLMETNVSPAGKSHWGFTKVNMGTAYTEALTSIKNDFIALAPPGKDLGTIITDEVPEGLEVDINSISHEGVYDPTTHTITWDLSDKNEGEITVEFFVTVKKQPQLFLNTGNISYYTGTEFDTNTTYHRTQNPSLTITKTLKNETDGEKDFNFKVYLMSTPADPLTLGQIFYYEGGAIENSGAQPLPNGFLMLDGDNAVSFDLKHGQTITIKDIPADYSILIFEYPETQKYTTWYTVNGGAETENTVALVSMANPGVRVDFVNKRIYAPPTGIEENGSAMGWMILDLALVALAAMAAMEIRRRRMR